MQYRVMHVVSCLCHIAQCVWGWKYESLTRDSRKSCVRISSFSFRIELPYPNFAYSRCPSGIHVATVSLTNVWKPRGR